MESLFYACKLQARHKTNLQLFHEVYEEFTSPQTWREIEYRGLAYLFVHPMNLQDFYELIKLKKIDLLFIRGEND